MGDTLRLCTVRHPARRRQLDTAVGAMKLSLSMFCRQPLNLRLVDPPLTGNPAPLMGNPAHPMSNPAYPMGNPAHLSGQGLIYLSE